MNINKCRVSKHKSKWGNKTVETETFLPCPLEAPMRKLIATMLTIKCANPSESSRLRQACNELEKA